jgi:hypothetical protein
MLLFVDMLRSIMLFVRGVKFQAPSIESFSVSMATSSIRPFEIWGSISMSFSGGRTSPPH